MEWQSLRSQFQSPPLEHEGKVFQAPRQKALALRSGRLERVSSADDLPNDLPPTVPRRHIQWDNRVPLEEARQALLGVGNTCPGKDQITVHMLRAAWPSIRKQVRNLYEACLELGHHPRAFREAQVVMIPKLNRNTTTYKGWRPISLLSCPGKGLERLIGRRLAWKIVSHGVLNPNVAGALPRRSVNDIVGAVVHDIEAQLHKGGVATLLTFDIEGVFDAALKNQLAHRLQEQGWPWSVIRWVLSFMTDRYASVRHEGNTTDMSPLHYGLPQGSPASPILFLL